ncbi:N2227-domain-containing protein [Saccharata proteae CBS 121410]|uniref:carnosine N-methyltransferase n=1 Tax=Saccharata proteae CBS 121410 TaxID=1314787 RepID=A0A9P4HW42_9PEZI|nr:N2227-domain-containing protein [Saccharata proteae CBS 121410]
MAVEGSEWQGQFDPFSDPEEKRVVLGTLDSFRSYRHVFHRCITHVRRQSFYALPAAHWELLAEPPFSVLDSFNAVDDAIDANADLAEAIFKVGLQSFGLSEEAGEESPSNERRHEGGEAKDRKPVWHGKANDSAMEKARSTIRQMFRDWSAEGAAERAASYNPILEALSKEYAHIPDPQKGFVKVLVPGAGLGRLMVEICCAGYSVEGNEISYHQLMASSFILNHTRIAEQFALYPWALQFSNHRSRAHQLQKVMVPDIHPATALEEASEGMEMHAFERMSMTASDFCVSYREEENRDAFDAVATCFFIDTAPNLINYIETIRHCLKTGGVWINLGPLLWHFENDTTWSKKREESNGQNPAIDEGNRGIDEPGSVELTDEEVVKLVERFGFKIEKHSSGEIEAGYIANPRGMLRNVYQPSFWIARKQ